MASCDRSKPQSPLIKKKKKKECGKSEQVAASQVLYFIRRDPLSFHLRSAECCVPLPFSSVHFTLNLERYRNTNNYVTLRLQRNEAREKEKIGRKKQVYRGETLMGMGSRRETGGTGEKENGLKTMQGRGQPRGGSPHLVDLDNYPDLVS